MRSERARKCRGLVAWGLAAVVCGPIGVGAEPAPSAAWRHPSALVLADEGRWLFTANRRSGSVTVIDAAGATVRQEVPVGVGLSDLAAVAGPSRLIAIDEPGDELVVLRRDGPELAPAHRLKVPRAPVSVVVSADGRRAFVASPWARAVSVIDLGGSGREPTSPAIRAVVRVPFAPRAQLWLPGAHRLVVADSFGGKLAVVDVERGVVESLRAIPAHNIRGMALSGDGRRVLIAHQALNRRATTSFDDVHWGNLITNNVRSLSVAAVLDPAADVLEASQLVQLGEPGNGAGDPAGLAVLPDGSVLITLAGVGETALGSADGTGWRRLAVGRRPTAVATRPDGTRAYVANTFDDSVTVIDLTSFKAAAVVALGPLPELSARDRGERLFHDARLSLEGWMSCQSCHTDGHTNGLLADTRGDGGYGAPRRVLTLRGVGDTGPWAWNGGFARLEDQVRQSIEETMRGAAPDDNTVSDLIAYLRSLGPPPPVEIGPRDDALARGAAVFERLGCGGCHVPPTYTTGQTFELGPSGSGGPGALNPPSLRGVGQGEAFFHDGRAATLEEVVGRERHPRGAALSDSDREALARFLRSL